MPPYAGPIYIGTVALEKNRWKKGQEPSFPVSAWLPKFAAAGFDGVELWENHFAKADAAEREALRHAAPPVTILNSYCNFEDEGQADRERVAADLHALGATGVKWNFGHDADRLPEYKRNLVDWIGRLPDDLRLLCEVHARTVLETPAAAKAVFDEIDDPRIEIIFHGPPVELEKIQPWFDTFGDKVTHMHVQTRGGRFDRDPEASAARFANLAQLPFHGSICLEFVEGSASKEETMELVWENARADLAYLREHLG